MSRAAEAAQTQAEVLKLARLLEREPGQVAYLHALPLEDVRALRERVTEVLYDAHAGSLRRLAAASKLLPAAVSATIGERAFGPLLSARLTGLLDPARAVDMASRLPPPFLADVAVALDPRRASEVIARIPPEQISAITRELIARGEFVTMGRFVGYLTDGSIAAALAEIDDHALLQVAFVLEDKSGVGPLVALLPKRRLAGIVRAAADGDLWVQALDLLANIDERQARKIVATALEVDPAALEAMAAAVIEHDLWQEALAIAEYDDTLQDKLVEAVGSLSPRRRRELARQVREAGSLERLGALGEALGGALGGAASAA